MKVRAAALYFVIVIALIIGVLSAALITIAGFYQHEYQRQMRYRALQQNLESGINILLHSQVVDSAKRFSLFGSTNDSVTLIREHWGAYDIGTVKAFSQSDTLAQCFSMAHPIDSSKWAALYIIDEDRSISVSGKTSIQGDAYIPKAGVRPAYVDNQAYQGDERLIIGHKYNSEKKLPELTAIRLQELRKILFEKSMEYKSLPRQDSVHYSWYSSAHRVNLGNKLQTIAGQRFSGHLLIRSDTLLTIDSTATLHDVIIMAKAIVVKSGFSGNCQLFATDSITIEPRCTFSYPSSIGVLRFDNTYAGSEKITIGQACTISGLIFAYEQTPGKLLPFIDLCKQAKINGQIYVNGNVSLHAGVEIDGSIYTNRFIYTSTYTRYENYLINLTLDATALSPYYLCSELLPASKKDSKILQWLQ